MALASGTRFGIYGVTGSLGGGGMGEVYRARDTKLDRNVALKALSRDFQDDPERLARSEREAKVLALLSHPNIGGIYGLEESDRVRALALELDKADCGQALVLAPVCSAWSPEDGSLEMRRLQCTVGI